MCYRIERGCSVSAWVSIRALFSIFYLPWVCIFSLSVTGCQLVGGVDVGVDTSRLYTRTFWGCSLYEVSSMDIVLFVLPMLSVMFVLPLCGETPMRVGMMGGIVSIGI